LIKLAEIIKQKDEMNDEPDRNAAPKVMEELKGLFCSKK
jgi:hypothetical protein